MKSLSLLILTLLGLGISDVSLAASAACTGKVINPVSDICWDCLLPITIGHSTVQSSGYPDTDNPDSPVCVCSGRPLPHIGVAMGYWEPMLLVDVTRTPFCLVSLGGIQTGSSPQAGDITTADVRDNSSFFHVHAYQFPILQWLDLFPSGCRSGGVLLKPMYFSELDPTWNDDTLSMTLFPETASLGDLISQSACALDAASANVHLPQDNLFWCAGSQGTMYPVTRHVAEHVGGVQASVLLSERLLFKLHRLGLVKDSSAHHLCGEHYQPILPKSRYRYQMAYPVSTTKGSGCQPFGRSTIPWEIAYPIQETPLSAENYAYLIWRKRNCCS